ncbi:MAG: cohesin domain-containing protein, partial [Oscillospiraceae bacterium]
MKDKKKPFPSLHLDVSDFLPADDSEKQGLVIMRKSQSFWRDGFRRFRKNPIAMTSFIIILIIMVIAFIVPEFYPYSYEYQDRDSLDLPPMSYSADEEIRNVQGRETRLAFNIPENLGIKKAEILIEFDTSELDFKGIVDGPISHKGANSNSQYSKNGTKQTVLYSYDGEDIINESGSLFYIKFRSAIDSVFAKTDVKIVKCEMINEKGDKIPLTTIDGYVDIMENLPS